MKPSKIARHWLFPLSRGPQHRSGWPAGWLRHVLDDYDDCEESSRPKAGTEGVTAGQRKGNGPGRSPE
jgi:hypothetical protein